MILGIGADLCGIDRIRRSLSRFGDAWIEELFTADERAWCLAAVDPALLFARGFACKEACAKALGTGFAKRVIPREIELSTRLSAPAVLMHGTALSRLRRMTPTAHTPEFVITITNTEVLASSLAILQVLPTA